MHKDPATAHASNPESSPNPLLDQIFLQKKKKKKCIAQGHLQKITFVFVLEIAISPTNKHPSQIKTNLPKLRLQNKGVRQSPFFLSSSRGRTFPHSPERSQNSTDFSENKWWGLQGSTQNMATVELSKWHNCLWHLENKIQNVVRTPQLGYNNYFYKTIFILYVILRMSQCSYIGNKFTFQLCPSMNCELFNCLDF